MDQEQPWAKRMAEGIGELVAFYRDQREMSAQQLADRCKELGMPSISRTVITKLENHRREAVSTAELQVLARALHVPAVLLLFPLGHEDTVEVLPGLHVDPWDAIDWFTGYSDDPADASAGPQMNIFNPIILWAEHRRNDGLIPILRAELDKPDHNRRDASYLAQSVRGLLNVRNALVTSGLKPPALHPRTAEVLAEVERASSTAMLEVQEEMDALGRRGVAERTPWHEAVNS